MMNTVSVEQKGEVLKIQIQNRCTVFVKIILLLFLFPCMSLPIVGIMLAASSGKLSFGLIFGIFLFCVVIVYPFLKITIWQFYGKEIFVVFQDKVAYEACFKFLKNQFSEMKTDQLEILFSDRELKKEEKIGTLVFLDKGNKLKSALKVNETDYKKILQIYLSDI